ncbi:MAG: Ig-like domain-containing protein [Candidatus Methanoperedens sp.]|nr:Ig-like domain-containing protein [Candidatus Methanoperedens sp.]
MKKIKQMNTKLKIGMLLLIVALVIVPGASAVSSYVTPLNTLYGPGLSCGTCHVNPAGGGSRNAYGSAFSTAMKGGLTVTQALTSIGSPSGVTTPTSTSTPVLKTITVSPVRASKLVGATQTFTAAGSDQNGGSILISPATVWSSTNTTVGTIDSSGMFTALEPGITTIIATNGTDGTVIGMASATVIAPGDLGVTTIKVSPSTRSLAVNGTQIFTATAFDQLGNVIAAIFSWVSNNPAVGTIDSTGKFTALSAGTTTISAANGTTIGSAIVSVGTAPVGHNGTHEQEENEQQDEQEHTSRQAHNNTKEHTDIHKHINTQRHTETTGKNEND